MKRTILLLTAMGAMLLMYAGAALAVSELDQQNIDVSDAFNPNGGSTVVSSEIIWGQTFTAGVSGTLDKVSLLVFYTPPSGVGLHSDLIVEIKAVDASGQPTGPVLGSATVPAADFATTNSATNFRDIILARPAHVSSGTKYALLVSGTQTFQCDVFATPPKCNGWYNAVFNPSENPYPGGSMIVSTNAGATFFEDFGGRSDFGFKTYVDNAPADTTAPVVTLDSKPNSLTNDNTPTFEFSADEQATFECSLSTGADNFQPCESPKSYAAQDDGLYTFKVKATDQASNTSEVASYSFEIDATAPDAPSAPDLEATSDSGLSDTDNETSDATPTFSGTAEAGSTVRILVDGVQQGNGVATGGSYSITTDALSVGHHSVVAKAEDAAGNVSSTSGSLSVRVVEATACHTATNRITGTELANDIKGTSLADIILGLGGADTLTGFGGGDCISGDAGNDRIKGESGDDELLGGDGGDRISADGGQDLVLGEAGNDNIDSVDRIADTINCGPGTRDQAVVDRGLDTLIGCERVTHR